MNQEAARMAGGSGWLAGCVSPEWRADMGASPYLLGSKKNTMKRGKLEHFALPVFPVHRNTNDKPKASLFCGTGSKDDFFFPPTFA